MDILSRLLSLHPVRAALDIRCRFGEPWHLRHDEQHLGIVPYHFILDGSAWLQFGDQAPLALQAGDLVLFTRGSAHCLYTATGGEAAGVRVVEGTAPVRLHVNDEMAGGTRPVSDFLCGQFHFDAPASNALLQALPDMVLVRGASLPEGYGLRALAMLLREECGGDAGAGLPRAGAHAVVAGLAAALFALAMRAWLEQAGPPPGLLALLAHPRLQAAIQAMLDAPQAQWSLTQLAEVCHLSRATFARQFLQVAGATPGDVLLRLRMAQAARLLSYSKMGVAEIGEAVGYQSEAAFNRVFKKYSGVGPGAYRRSRRENTSCSLPDA